MLPFRDASKFILRVDLHRRLWAVGCADAGFGTGEAGGAGWSGERFLSAGAGVAGGRGCPRADRRARVQPLC